METPDEKRRCLQRKLRFRAKKYHTVLCYTGYGIKAMKDLFVWRLDPLVVKVSINEN